MSNETNRIEKLITDGRYHEALSLAVELGSHNNEAYIYYLAAERCEDTKNMEDAITMLKKALSLRKDSAPYWLSLGIAYQKMNYFVLAVEALEKARKYDPKDFDIYRNLGLVYRKVGNHKRSLQWYTKARDIYWDKVQYRVDNDIAKQKNRVEHMVPLSEYYAALKKDPLYAVLNNDIGLSLLSLYRYEEAMESFKKAIEFIPDHNDYYDPYVNFYEASRHRKRRKLFSIAG